MTYHHDHTGRRAARQLWLGVLALAACAFGPGPAVGDSLPALAHLGEASMACRDADAAAIRLMRPLVLTDGAIDTRVLKVVVSDLDLARSYCADGQTTQGLDAYRRVTDGLSRPPPAGRSDDRPSQ